MEREEGRQLEPSRGLTEAGRQCRSRAGRERHDEPSQSEGDA